MPADAARQSSKAPWMFVWAGSQVSSRAAEMCAQVIETLRAQQSGPVQGEAGVQMLLQGPAQVQHDFAVQPLCRVQLQLSLRNFLAGDVSAEATFGTSAPGLLHAHTYLHANSGTNFIFFLWAD